MTLSRFLIICSIFIYLQLFTGQSSAARIQTLIFYTEHNYTGKSETFTENEPDVQSNTEIGKIARSYCIPAGVWFLNGVINGEVTFNGWTSANIGRVCISWHNESRNQTAIYNSIRRVAGTDLDELSMSLYSQYNFQGEETHVNTKEFHLNNPPAFNSIAFTGIWNWTVFNETGFSGPSECVLAQNIFGEYGVSFVSNRLFTVSSGIIDCRTSLRSQPEVINQHVQNTNAKLTVEVLKQTYQPGSGSDSQSEADISINLGGTQIGFITLRGTISQELLYQVQNDVFSIRNDAAPVEKQPHINPRFHGMLA